MAQPLQSSKLTPDVSLEADEVREYVSSASNDPMQMLRLNASRGAQRHDLIPPHGGLSEPINRTVPANETSDFLKEAAKLPRVPISDADLSSLYRFGDGGLSPLTGLMDKATFDRVLDE